MARFAGLTSKVSKMRHVFGVPKCLASSATGKLVFHHFFAAPAEFERNLISERTEEELKAARNRGGRKPALNAKATEQIKLLMKDRSIRPTDLAKTYRMSRATVYDAAKESA